MDPKTIHDLRNSIMVVRNLSRLIKEGKLKDGDKEQAYTIINDECEKIIELLK